MNKRLVLLSCFLLVSVAAYAQYPYKWQIGGTMGMGGTIYTDGGDPTMSMTIGFNKAVQNTKWRWSIEAGIMNQGIVDYSLKMMRPTYLSVRTSSTLESLLIIVSSRREKGLTFLQGVALLLPIKEIYMFIILKTDSPPWD